MLSRPSCPPLTIERRSSQRWSRQSRVHAHDEGCELYALHEGDDRLVMIEKWSSEQALETRGAGEAIRPHAAAAGQVARRPRRPDSQGTSRVDHRERVRRAEIARLVLQVRFRVTGMRVPLLPMRPMSSLPLRRGP